jgi:hypothetical protein
VTLSGPPCTRGNPTVTLLPAQTQSLKAGTVFSYTLLVTSTDSETCTPAVFSPAAAAPSGWTSVFAAPTLTIVPGSSASTAMLVTSAATAADGVYAISAAAINGADVTKSGSASSTYTVLSRLTVPVSTGQTSYTRNQTVTISANVFAGSSPASGANVIFTITASNGITVSSKGTTDTNGAASYALHLKPKAQLGMYQVNVTASVNSLSGSGTTTFSVR